MKIKNIQLKNHEILKNLNIDFLDKDGKAQELIVIAGSNGSGKTNLLEAIYNYFLNKNNEVVSKTEIEFLNEEADLKKLSKVIYMPTEINFSEIKNASDKYKYEYKFLNKVDSSIVKDIPSYLATKVKLMQKNNEDMTYKQIKDKVSEETNEIFEELELDIKMIGFTPDEKDLPLFSNSFGEVFDINGLSSGEKQLFMRALTLKMIEAENAIILIDEPEISLHPKWQQKIIKIYQNIGDNNQVIIATHSPHIIGSVKNENVRVMRKSSSGIEIKKLNELTYGQSMDNILENVMELEDILTPDISQELKKLHKMIMKAEYKTKEFEILYKTLREVLGPHNEELMLLELQLKATKARESKLC
ncbi:MAG: AAA family ATPase [Cetobacterium sp.]|uniref:AAA family ATPase n=1 Tax=Cetobacterium sp. TaxID=2071632 RepID=UPI003F35DB2E